MSQEGPSRPAAESEPALPAVAPLAAKYSAAGTGTESRLATVSPAETTRGAASPALRSVAATGAGPTTGAGAWAHAASTNAIDVDRSLFTTLLTRPTEVTALLPERKRRPDRF